MRLGIVPRTRGLSADEAAALWVVRRDRGEPGDAEFDRWIQDPLNAEAYARANDAMDLFDQTDGADANLRALRLAALNAAPAPRRASRFAAAAAAALVVASGAAFIAEHPFGRAPTAVSAAPDQAADMVQTAAATAPRNYSTEIGQRRTIRLPDGTKVTLDTQTRIATAFDKGERLVRLLHGTALFEVAHNRHWPFVVEAADRQVTALGTVFEVSNYPGRLHVLLVQGSVRVARDDTAPGSSGKQAVPPIILKPGQSLLAELGMPQKISVADVSRQLLWRDGFVEFDDETLGAAVTEINRYIPQPIVLANDGTAGLHVSGVFRTGSAQSFVDTVSELLPVDARPARDGSVELSMTK